MKIKLKEEHSIDLDRLFLVIPAGEELEVVETTNKQYYVSWTLPGTQVRFEFLLKKEKVV